jgi:hypothetical protein
MNEAMKRRNLLRVRAGAIAAFVVTLVWTGCQPTLHTIGTRTCEESKWTPQSYSIQDILPGVESNLQAQRTYVVSRKDGADGGAAETASWFLATDSVLLPMRFRLDSEGAAQWSGTRNFYGEVRPGVPTLAAVFPSLSGASLTDTAWLIRESAEGCMAVSLPPVQKLQAIAAP